MTYQHALTPPVGRSRAWPLYRRPRHRLQLATVPGLQLLVLALLAACLRHSVPVDAGLPPYMEGPDAANAPAAGKKSYTARNDVELHALTQYNAAVRAERERRLADAVQLYRQAIADMPYLCDAHLNLGNLYAVSGRVELGLQHLRQAYTLGGQQGDAGVVAGAWNNIGLALQRTGGRDPDMLRRAAEAYGESLKAMPGQPEARYNLGRLRETQGELGEAERLYQEVLAIDSSHSGALTNMGNVRLLQNRLQEAADYYSAVERAASKQGGHIAAANRRSGMFNLAQALKQNRQTTRAIQVLEGLLREEPDDVLHLALLQATRTAACVWNATDDEARLIAATFANVAAMEARAGGSTGGGGAGANDNGDDAAHAFQDVTSLDRVGLVVEGATVFQAMQLPVSSQRIRRLAVALSELQHKGTPPAFRAATLRLAPPPPHMPQTQRPSRLRIAYVSYDFRTHPMGYLTLGVLLRHDRARVQVQCYHYGPGVASSSSANGGGGDSVVPMTARIASACDSFVHAHAMSPAELAARIRDAGAHVLVDLMAHTTHARLGVVAAKPAPVVVNYLGCPCTSGGASTDHVVVDAVVAPVEERGAFSEARVYVPQSYQANFYEMTVPLCRDADGACLTAHRLRYGLPGDPRIAVLANFNTLDKLRPLSFATWMRVMRRHPASVLWLLQPRDSAVQRRLVAEAAARGVHASRLVFAPRMPRLEHLARYQAVDLFLDTHVYTAHSTAADAMWGATPLLVCPSATFQGRVSASLLRSMRTPWLEASSFKEYEAAAVALLRRREALLWRLRRHMSSQLLRAPTFDTALVTRHLERGYRAMWEQRAAAGIGTAASRPRSSLLHVVVDPVDRRTPVATPGKLLDLAQARHAVAADASQSQAVAAALAREVGGGRALQALQRLERRLDAAMQTGLRMHNDGDTEAATAVYTRILGAVPDHPDGTHFSGLIRYANGDHLEAVTQVLASIELAKAHPDYDPQKAFVANLNNVVAGAVTALTHQAQADASDYEALWSLGKIHSAVGQHEEAQAAMWAAVRRQNAVEHALAVHDDAALVAQRRVPRPSGVRTIAIYCNEYGQTWWPHWGPRSLLAGGGGAGGSEEAVILLARALVERGYHVEVYNDVVGDDVGVARDGVVWYPYRWYDASDPPDAFVAWRYSVSAALGESAPSVHVWLQDLPDLAALFTPDVTAAVDGIFVLCKFHASHLPPHARNKAVLSTNAMDPAGFVDGPNRRLTFIYASSPSRGLEQVLTAWPYIYDELGSDARLEVYYGFTPGFVRHAKRTMSDYDSWRARMDALLQQPGVSYIGLVPPAALARAYAGAGFALYPTSYPETSCVAMMKAMAMGAIPITSRHPHSALPELTALWDLGPRVPSPAPGGSSDGADPLARGIAQDAAWLQRWASHVVAAAHGDAATLVHDLGQAAPAEAVAAAATEGAGGAGEGTEGAGGAGEGAGGAGEGAGGAGEGESAWVGRHRAAMKVWARQHLTWAAVAANWADDVLFRIDGT